MKVAVRAFALTIYTEHTLHCALFFVQLLTELKHPLIIISLILEVGRPLSFSIVKVVQPQP